MNSAYEKLLDSLKGLGSVTVAFSGGVDSTFLAYAAREALGDQAVAITVESPYIPKWELEEAKALAEQIGIRHIIVPTQIHESIMNNPPDRCYLCKKILFSMILEKSSEVGAAAVADGSNYDDLKDYRPGMKALQELKVVSPLLDCQWTKDMIREASARVNLPTYDKPAYACLLTRLPYGTAIDTEELVRIERAEIYMMELGFKAVRVRSHGDLARIEVAREKRKELFDEDLLDRISEALKSYGYRYVTIEASGYAMGSFNRQIGQ